ncbi:hypothetical protein GobsT_71250 [Gemmata obscuriglobus]|nr:hypothetical protein GobsT_71250 [Gemmata obscuriglobus]VTS11628.1 unnamed protein product [Gemmata obscuriglobus UQM 2246]
MRLGVGLAINQLRRRDGLTNPLAAFGASYSVLAAWMRTNGLLYQDAAKTTRASSHLDPVRVAVWPYGPSGAVEFVAPSDAARPLLYSEGGNLYSLSFDGVDDCLIANANEPVPLGGSVTVGMRANASVKASSTACLYGSSSVGGITRGHHVRIPPNSIGLIAILYGSNGGAGTLLSQTSGTTFTAGTPFTLVAEFDAGISQTRLSKDGGAPATINWSTGVPYPATSLNIGAEAGLNNYLGRMPGFSLLFGDPLSAGTKSALEAYLGGL